MRILLLTAMIVMLIGAACSTSSDKEIAIFGRVLLVSGLMLSCLVAVADWGNQ